MWTGVGRRPAACDELLARPAQFVRLLYRADTGARRRRYRISAFDTTISLTRTHGGAVSGAMVRGDRERV